MAFGWLFRRRKHTGPDEKLADKGVCHTVTGSASQKVPEQTTILVVQVLDKSLPYSLVKEICDRKHITELDLSQCPNLEVLPAAFAACGLGSRLTALKLPMRLESENYKDLSPRKKLAAILLRQRRRHAILKLATQPEPMLTTLERLSWVLIILATITLTAFLQPGMKAVASNDPAEIDVPGCLANLSKGFKATAEAASYNSSSTSSRFSHLSDVQKAAIICHCTSDLRPQPPPSDTEDRWLAAMAQADISKAGRRRLCNKEAEALQWNINWTKLALVADAACKQLQNDTMSCYEKANRLERVAAFAMFTVLSFCGTLLCLMLIVVVSLPRLRSTDLAYEAGRLWLFLLFIWLFFVEAVQLAFLSFWQYAWLVYDVSNRVAPADRIVDGLHNFGSIFEARSYFDIFVPWYEKFYSLGLFWSAGIPGTSKIILATSLLATVPALILVCVHFGWMYPGHRAVHLACCSCSCTGYTQDFVDNYVDRRVHEGNVAIYVSPAPPAIIKVE